MTPGPGTRIGHCEVVVPIVAGVMGEVSLQTLYLDLGFAARLSGATAEK